MRKVYLLHFPFELMAAAFYSCWAAVLLSEGRTLSQSALALAMFYLAMSAFQIPTGMLADRYGRKKCASLGAALFGIGALLVAVMHSKDLLLLAFGTMGVGLTFVDGAKNAWLRNLAEQQQPDLFLDSHRSDSFYLNLDLVGRMGTILGAFGGVALFRVSPSMFWLVLSCVAFAALLTTAFQDSAKSDMQFLKFDFCGVCAGVAKNHALLIVLVAGALFGIEQGIRNLVNQPYVLEITQGKEFYLAIFQSALAGARIFGNLFYRKVIRGIIGNQRAVAIGLALMVFGVAEILASHVGSFFAFLVPYALGVFCLGWYFPLRDSLVNTLVSEQSRATLVSMDAMLINLAACGTLMVLASMEFDSVIPLWQVGGGALLMAALAFGALSTFQKTKSV